MIGATGWWRARSATVALSDLVEVPADVLGPDLRPHGGDLVTYSTDNNTTT
jgi:hypothetical protein